MLIAMMNPTYGLVLFAKKRCNGFTLLELMIVMIIAGILAVISIPSFTKQIGKARESEIKFIIGTVNRAQQAYHWEKGQFAQGADDSISLNLLNVAVSSKYVTSLNIIGNENEATIAPSNSDYEQLQLRGYAGGMFTSAGNYSQVMCQASAISVSTPPPISPTDCVTGIIIK